MTPQLGEAVALVERSFADARLAESEMQPPAETRRKREDEIDHVIRHAQNIGALADATDWAALAEIGQRPAIPSRGHARMVAR